MQNWKEFQDASPLEEQIDQWFFANEELNIGILTGPTSGLVVIDCDSEEATRTFLEQYPEAGNPLQAKTGKLGEEVMPAIREIARELGLPGPYDVDPRTNEPVAAVAS